MMATEDDLTADCFSCGFVVSSDHNESDSSSLAQLDGPRHLLSRRIMHPGYPYQRQITFILSAQLQTQTERCCMQLDTA